MPYGFRPAAAARNTENCRPRSQQSPLRYSRGASPPVPGQVARARHALRQRACGADAFSSTPAGQSRRPFQNQTRPSARASTLRPRRHMRQNLAREQGDRIARISFERSKEPAHFFRLQKHPAWTCTVRRLWLRRPQSCRAIMPRAHPSGCRNYRINDSLFRQVGRGHRLGAAGQRRACRLRLGSGQP